MCKTKCSLSCINNIYLQNNLNEFNTFFFAANLSSKIQSSYLIMALHNKRRVYGKIDIR